MIDYNDIKDLIIYTDAIVGDMTLDYILKGLLDQIESHKKFEEIVYSNLKQTNLSDEDISSILNLSAINIIEMYIKLIKDEL